MRCRQVVFVIWWASKKKPHSLFLMMPRCLFVWREMDIKGKTEKHERLNLSTQTWAFVSDWWSKKFRHADLTVFLSEETAIVPSFKRISSCFSSFLLTISPFLSFSLFSFHTFVFLDPFLKGQTDYHVPVLAHPFVRCRDHSREWKRGAVTLRPLCCCRRKKKVVSLGLFLFDDIPVSISQEVFSPRSVYTTPLVPLGRFMNSFLLSTDIAVFKGKQAVLISIYSSQQRQSCFFQIWIFHNCLWLSS